MRRIDYILIFLVFLFGIFPSLNSFIPQWNEWFSIFFYFSSGIGAIDIVLLFMLALTIYRYSSKWYVNIKKIGVGGVIILFFLWMLFEIIRNIGQYGLSAPGEFRTRYLILVLPFYIALNFNTIESRKKLAKFLIYISYFIPLLYIPVVGMLKGWSFGAEDRFLSASIYLGMVYGLTLIWLSNKYRYLKFSKKILIVSLFPFIFFFIIDSHRSVWLATAVILGLLTYLNELKVRRYYKVIPVILVLGAILIRSINDMGFDLSNYIEQRGSAFLNPEADATSNWRLIMWTAQLEKFAESPILGEGFGGYWTVVFPNGQIVNISPHSYYVQTLVKVGIIGMALYLIIVFKLFRKLRIFLKKAKKKFNPEMPLIILGFCVLITMHVYYIVYSLEYYSLIYLGLAIAVVLDKKYYLNET